MPGLPMLTGEVVAIGGVALVAIGLLLAYLYLRANIDF